ncbi:MAG: ABC transporter permease, partial [Saprospiraceae bacterium]|nr:ABC transporter permease [Saprospiraceae bacterium]
TLLGMTLAEFEATGQYARFALQRLPDIHLHSDLTAELQPNGDIKYIWIFSSIALFVLLIACINFMNLTTAKSSQRGEEIAVRKVLGSSRKQLIFQFLGEAFVMAFLSVILAVVATLVLLPWFNELTGVDLTIPWMEPSFWLALIGGTLVVALLAGSYPALFLSGFKPIQVLKNRMGSKGSASTLRSALVVFQFLIATTLIIGTLLIYNQLRFIQSKELGFQKEQIIVLNDAFALEQNIEAFKQRMLQNPNIESATVSSYLPTPSSRSNTTYSKIREFRQDQSINMANWTVDHDYAKTLKLELKEGRFFDRDFPSDSSAVVLNEAAIAVLGYDDPIGKKVFGLEFSPQGAPAPEDFQEFTIIGVVKDFHFESLRENIGSLGLFLGQSTGLLSLRYHAEASTQVISELEFTWQEMAPDQPFSYQFVDESFEKIYEADQRVGSIATVFSLLAIIVSCLGLFGLSTFVVEQRTKEIGIRKVLGASVSGIVGLLSKGFLKLVLIAFILAVPLTWYLMQQWLSNFAYRIEIRWSVFIVSGIIALAIAFSTISFQSLRAAIANPVDSLKNE